MKMTNGIIVINKDINYTSRDVVNIVSKIFKTKKVGHTGTLDPLATGVLVIVFGKYTKLVNLLTSLDKTYIAEIKLGTKTDTLDITGNIIETKDFAVTKEQILEVLNSFKGIYQMEVPIYSAIKVNGKKLYEYARNNTPVTLPIKKVNIYDIKLLDFHDDLIKIEVNVEKGTYIRSLIRDICEKLNTVGTMNNLIRTKQGKFKIEDAYSIKDIKDGNFKVLNIRDVLNLREYNLNDEEYFKIKNGNPIKLNYSDEYILFTYNREDIALYQKDNDIYKCLIMLKDNN